MSFEVGTEWPEVLDELVAEVFDRVMHRLDETAVSAAGHQYVASLRQEIVDQPMTGPPIAEVYKAMRIGFLAETGSVDQQVDLNRLDVWRFASTKVDGKSAFPPFDLSLGDLVT